LALFFALPDIFLINSKAIDQANNCVASEHRPSPALVKLFEKERLDPVESPNLLRGHTRHPSEVIHSKGRTQHYIDYGVEPFECGLGPRLLLGPEQVKQWFHLLRISGQRCREHRDCACHVLVDGLEAYFVTIADDRERWEAENPLQSFRKQALSRFRIDIVESHNGLADVQIAQSLALVHILVDLLQSFAQDTLRESLVIVASMSERFRIACLLKVTFDDQLDQVFIRQEVKCLDGYDHLLFYSQF